MKSQYRSRVNRTVTTFAATIGFAGTLACIAVVAIGGAPPTYKHGTSIVAPRTGDVWQVGELHTAQWTMNGASATTKAGENITAMLILSYSGGSENSHVLLAHLTNWFPISDRLANVMVPSVPTRDDYSLYIFSHDDRDVSSWSGSITIFNPDDVDGDRDPPDSLDITTAPPVSVTMSLTSTYSDSTLPTVYTSSSIAAENTVGIMSAPLSSSSSSSTVSVSESVSASLSAADADAIVSGTGHSDRRDVVPPGRMRRARAHAGHDKRWDLGRLY